MAYSSLENKKGVTLVELLIVISIIAIVVVLTVPAIKPNKLDGATRMIYSDLILARMQAVAKGNNFRVIFGDPKNTPRFEYEIHNDKNSDGNPDGEEVIVKDIRKDYRGVTISANVTVATFNPRGTCRLGTVTLRRADITQCPTTPNPQKCRYVIFSWTGRVRISDTPP